MCLIKFVVHASSGLTIMILRIPYSGQLSWVAYGSDGGSVDFHNRSLVGIS